MKKVLIFSSLFIMLSQVSFAQGGVNISNSTSCSVGVALVAKANGAMDPACSIETYGFSLAASCSPCYSASDYSGLPAAWTWYSCPGLLPTSPVAPSFKWTDAAFKFTCGSSTGGGSVGDASSTCITSSEAAAWSGTVGGVSVNVSWLITISNTLNLSFY